MPDPRSNPEKVGLPYWMDRVLEEHSKLGEDLSPDAVHDLRIALRRCMLIADVMRDLDAGGDWKSMRKVARWTFHRLGALRDTQVLEEWIGKLRAPDDHSAEWLVESLKKRYEEDANFAREAVDEFDRKQWREWMRELTNHYKRVASDRPTCESVIFEIWEAVRDLHRRAQKSRSRVAYHRLRVGLKRFRYAVENFMPSMSALWAPDLRFLQDVLGEAHDISVLEQAIVKHRSLAGAESRASWRKKLDAEWSSRIQQYRAKMAGKSSLLWAWREGLPAERELRPAGLSRLSEWAYFVTPNFSRVRRVARLSLQLYDGFENCGLIARDKNIEERFVLHAAALLQEVGHFNKDRAHHKESYRMIRRIAPPPGWSKTDIEITALIARFHRRALPRLDHKMLKTFELSLRHSLVLLAAILRFANALQAKPYRAVRRLEVENCAGVIVVRAEGFPDQEPLSPKLSVAKRLLEFACQRSLHILSHGTRLIVPQIVQSATRSDAA